MNLKDNVSQIYIVNSASPYIINSNPPMHQFSSDHMINNGNSNNLLLYPLVSPLPVMMQHSNNNYMTQQSPYDPSLNKVVIYPNNVNQLIPVVLLNNSNNLIPMHYNNQLLDKLNMPSDQITSYINIKPSDSFTNMSTSYKHFNDVPSKISENNSSISKDEALSFIQKSQHILHRKVSQPNEISTHYTYVPIHKPEYHSPKKETLIKLPNSNVLSKMYDLMEKIQSPNYVNKIDRSDNLYKKMCLYESCVDEPKEIPNSSALSIKKAIPILPLHRCIYNDKSNDKSMDMMLSKGWKRITDENNVYYISPSGTKLSSIKEVESYLLTDGTCKCGLVCPIFVEKTFNFNICPS